MSKSFQRVRREKYNVFAEEVNKIAISANNDTKQLIQQKHTHMKETKIYNYAYNILRLFDASTQVKQSAIISIKLRIYEISQEIRKYKENLKTSLNYRLVSAFLPK